MRISADNLACDRFEPYQLSDALSGLGGASEACGTTNGFFLSFEAQD
jgi:hypothetical protein